MGTQKVVVQFRRIFKSSIGVCNMSAKAELDESAMQEAETEDEAEEVIPSEKAETSNGGRGRSP